MLALRSSRNSRALHTPKARIALIKDGVHGAKEHITQNVEALVATRLDAAVREAITQILEHDVRGVDGEEVVANGELDLGDR